MIKDRNQKKIAAKFCAVQGMVPFLEVLVRSSSSVDDVPVNITDIDVMGLDVRRSGEPRRLLFDCKTANKQSGVNRALWASGLKNLVNADVAFVIQNKVSPDTHRLAAASFGVNIHSEDTFRRYAMAASSDFVRDVTYLDDLDKWDEFFALSSKSPKLSDLIFFLTTQSPLELSGQKGVRNAISVIMKTAGELDPEKPIHNMVFGCLISSFMMHIFLSISSLKDIFEFNMPKNEFERLVRYFIWEGRENYELRLKLRRALLERDNETVDSHANFDLPEWGKFLELVRSFLESPDSMLNLSFLAKEMAFRSFGEKNKEEADARISTLIHGNKRARQFIFMASNYICAAAGVPKDFAKNIESSMNSLVV